MRRRPGLHCAASTKHDIISVRVTVVLVCQTKKKMRVRATYVDPDAPLSLVQLEDFVLWRRTILDHSCPIGNPTL